MLKGSCLCGGVRYEYHGEIRELSLCHCAQCGNPLYSGRNDLPGIKRLRLGTVDTPFTCRSAYLAFIGSKASCFRITDDLPPYPAARP